MYSPSDSMTNLAGDVAVEFAAPVESRDIDESLLKRLDNDRRFNLKRIDRQPLQPGTSNDSKVGNTTDGSESSDHGLLDFKSGELSFFSGIDGSKQPQDYGVNANIGTRYSVALAAPLIYDRGIGYQMGIAYHDSVNAVRVFELLGESTERWQLYTTLGIFQRRNSGFAWGIVYDYLYQESYDNVDAGQFRVNVQQHLTTNNWIGVRASIKEHGDQAEFLGTPLSLEPISQGGFYVTHRWPLRALTTVLIGMSESHSQSNAVTGFSNRTGNSFLFASELFVPLSQSFALYGETNLLQPADTGTVDAFLGLEWVPGGGALTARTRAFSPLQTLAGPTSMPIDLR